jgi:hypothetical protein
VTDEAQQRTTMVHALREEPGSYTRTLENGAEVIYAIRPLNGGYIAEWEYVAGSGPEEQPTRSHKEEFRTHADALRYLEQNFDAPLAHEEGS